MFLKPGVGTPDTDEYEGRVVVITSMYKSYIDLAFTLKKIEC